MCDGLVKLSRCLISKTPVNPDKCIRVLFQVMAYIHFLKDQTAPFAKCELHPLKIRLEASYPVTIGTLKRIASSVEKWVWVVFVFCFVACAGLHVFICTIFVQLCRKSLLASATCICYGQPSTTHVYSAMSRKTALRISDCSSSKLCHTFVTNELERLPCHELRF